MLSKLTAAVLAAGLFAGTASASDDLDKLKALEAAMRAGSAPAANAPAAPSKPRKRAIVFDNEAESAEPAAPAAAPVAKSPMNCAALPPDVPATAVDFAIQFRLGSAEVASTSEPVLREIAKIISLTPDRCVIVEGHTDASGSADRNLQLSRERADSVVRFIVEKAGISSQRLIPVGKGSSETLKNLDPRNPVNRRVVFKVVS